MERDLRIQRIVHTHSETSAAAGCTGFGVYLDTSVGIAVLMTARAAPNKSSRFEDAVKDESAEPRQLHARVLV